MDARERASRQLDQIEKQYRQVIDALQEQFETIEERLDEFLDDVQEQLPEAASEAMQRTREFSAENRERIASWSAQAREATSDAIDAAVSAVQGLAGRDEAETATTIGPDSTKAELYAEAARLDIKGRSSMTKAELRTAIDQAG